MRSTRNAEWIEEYCVIPEGKLVGQPVKLTKDQREWLRLIYDSPTRQFILSMPRKNAKTVFSAFLLLLHLCGPEAQRNSQLYSAAQSRDQAALLFAYAAKIVRMSPDLREFVGVRDTAKQLYCPEIGTVYKALSAEASTTYGASPAFVVHDELGQVRGPRSDLYDAIETAVGAQESPLSIVISTQAPTDADLLSVLIDDALSGEDPTIKAVVYRADKDADPFDEGTIRACNPHYDDFMNQDEVKRMAQNAKRMPSMEASYRNLILNQRVEAKQPYIPRSLWDANGANPRPLKGRLVRGGLDLSSVNDLTALVLAGEDDGWDIEATFWLPQEGIAERARSDRVPYDVWAQDGFIELCPGASIEYEYVALRLREVFDDHEVEFIAFDRWGMRHLNPWLVRAGFTDEEIEKFVPHGQGFKDMTPALRETESLLLNHKLRHGMHPVLRMCAANAVVQSDPAGNRKLVKNRSSGRIDGMVSLAMCFGPVNEEESKLDIDAILDNPLRASFA